MRDRLYILLIVCALVLVPASSVAAVTNHNLEWGFEVGDQFHYIYTEDATIPDWIISPIDLYVEINSLPTIPTNVTLYTEISIMTMVSTHYTWYYDNGTESYESPTWAAVSIGNLSLVQELLDDYSSHDFEWIDSPTEWGVTFVEDFDTLIATTTIKFSKTDGVLSLYQRVQEPSTGPMITIDLIREGFQPTTSSTSTTTQTTPPDGFTVPMELLLALGIGGSAVVAIVIIFLLRK